jgi:hypothetical protein
MRDNVTRKGPWSVDRLDRFLDESRVPLHIAGVGVSGYPVMASLWYIRIEGMLWCATQKTAAVAVTLGRDARCSFEVSVEKPPYVGVRGPALATMHPERGEEILCALIDRYIGSRTSKFSQKLLSSVASETAIAIDPQALLTWDFNERMDGV